jgi:hypothetical protein
MNYKVETVSLKSLAKEQAARNKAKYSGDPVKEPHPSALLQFGDGDGSWFDRYLTAPNMPTQSTYSRGYKKPVSGFKSQKQRKSAAAIKQGKHNRSKLVISDAERKLFSQQFDSDSSFDSDYSTSGSDDDDDDIDDKRNERSDRKKHTTTKSSVVLPRLTFNHQNGTPKTKLAERDSPRTRKFVGPNARRRFFWRFQKEWKTQTKTQSTPNFLPLNITTLGSARGKFLARCAAEELAPHPAMIRKFKSKELNLQGMSLGDGLGLCLAEALPCIPHLQALDLSCNRMTGLSIGKALNAVELKDTVCSINLSDNSLGSKGMSALTSFLANTSCLETLELERTRSGDAEAKLLCDGLCLNKTVTFLNVANNLFAETSGHCFAKMLRRLPSTEDSRQLEDGSMRIISSVCVLTNLDLSWNQIRKTGAAAMGRAFLYNDKLNTLDLSYCAFGDEGTSVIMDSLRTNTTLTWLELDNNAIKGRGSMVTAFCLEHNYSLKYLQLWENPIGSSGGRSLLRSVSRTGDVREMQLDKCNFEIEEDSIFDPEAPPSTMTLDLENLYDRACATEFFRVIQHRPGTTLSVFTLDDRNVSFDQYEPEELDGWKSDGDGDGDGDSEERDGEEEKEKEEDSSSDEEEEEAKGGDKDIRSERPAHMEINVEELLFRVDGREFDVPCSGILHVECSCEPRKPLKNAAVSNEGVKGLISIIFGQEESTPREIMLRLKTAMRDAYLTAKQARKILKKFHERKEKREAMELILPKLIDPKQKFQVLQQNLQPKDIEAVERRMGAMFYFTSNNVTGHYELNLENENDRKVAQAIFYQNNEDIKWAEKSGRGDTSQHANWSGIRNALYRNKEVILDAVWSANVPREGVLELDYVSCRTAPKSARRMIMTSSKFLTFVKDLGLQKGGTEFESKPEYTWALAANVLSLLRGRTKLSDLGGKAQRKEACSRVQKWWRNQLRANREKEEIAHSLNHVPSDEELQKNAANRLQNWYLQLCQKWGFQNGLPPSAIVRQSLLKGAGGSGMLGLIRRALVRQAALDARKSRRVVLNGLMPLRRRISRTWVTCRQVAHLMACFHSNFPKHCRVDVLQMCFSRIVDLENLFVHIMNCTTLSGQRLLKRLKSDECIGGKITREMMFQSDYEEAIKRIGWLNMFNPKDPDLTYDLDHSRHDHYQLVLMLTELADVEPGENFVDETFTKWDKQQVNTTGEKGAFVMIPGWELPMSWLDPGPPTIGHLHVEYYSGRDPSQGSKEDPRGRLAGLEGCAPIWDLRAGMMEKVLLGNRK